jgi:hypothetical protein
MGTQIHLGILYLPPITGALFHKNYETVLTVCDFGLHRAIDHSELVNFFDAFYNRASSDSESVLAVCRVAV